MHHCLQWSIIRDDASGRSPDRSGLRPDASPMVWLLTKRSYHLWWSIRYKASLCIWSITRCRTSQRWWPYKSYYKSLCKAKLMAIQIFLQIFLQSEADGHTNLLTSAIANLLTNRRFRLAQKRWPYKSSCKASVQIEDLQLHL